MLLSFNVSTLRYLAYLDTYMYIIPFKKDIGCIRYPKCYKSYLIISDKSDYNQ